MSGSRPEGGENPGTIRKKTTDVQSVEGGVSQIFAEAQTKRGKRVPTTLDDIEKRCEVNEALGRPE
jgi:hypothetical protein